MANWHRSSGREDRNSTGVDDGSFSRLWRTVIPTIVLVASLTSCSGKKRDFAEESGLIPDTTSEGTSNDPGAAGSANTGGSIPSDPTDTPGTEGNGVSETPLDMAAAAGTGLCDADAGCTCNEEVQSCDPLPLCDGGVDCVSSETCAGCIIDGECIAAESPNPNNFCEVCDPDQSSNGWSNADGVTCDDGAFCTVDDACRLGACVGSPRECDDDVECNGVSTCDEDADACAPGQSQCGANSACDAVTGTCVSTCAGCIVSGTCHATGAEEPGNPCRVCDPARSTSAFVAASGKACGAPAGVCSAQDTCNAQGQCQPNHSPDGTGCGNAASSACDGPDTCDGRGNCLPRIAANSTSCNDGRFCSVGDACQGGVCSPTGNRNCGDGLACNENLDQCQCQGCVVGGNCFAPGTLNGNNPCQICDPARSTVSFSGNTGARCGAGSTECSAQDTCDAEGVCRANHLPQSTSCGSNNATACDAADSCDGAGTCSRRIAANDTPCDDGQFCTVGDECQSGGCVGSPRNCGSGQSCNETSNACQCAGCQINGTCVAANATNPSNPCQVCDPQRSTSSFSPSLDPLCPAGGLVAYYPFNGDGDDASGNQNDCQITGPVLAADRLGRANRAYRFDGIDDEMACGVDRPALDITGALTIAAWFNADAPSLMTSNRALISKGLFSGNGPSRAYTLLLQNQDQSGSGLCGQTRSATFIVSQDGIASPPGGTACGTTAFQPNTWHHTVGVFQPGARVAVYIDGALSFENTANVPTQILNVDRSLRLGINNVVVFQGVLDEVRIYNRALSAVEVVALHGGTQ